MSLEKQFVVVMRMLRSEPFSMANRPTANGQNACTFQDSVNILDLLTSAFQTKLSCYG